MADYHGFSDSELADRFGGGDARAYTEIYQRYFRPLFAHVFKKLGDEEEAKDVVQELFATLWQKQGSLQFNSLSAYLYSAARNRILDRYSHRGVEDKYIGYLQHHMSTMEAGPADALVREKELLTFVQREIDKLPPKMREIFILSRVDRLSHQEIAERLKLSPQTVSKQVGNALNILRKKLGLPIFLAFFYYF